MSIFLCSVFLVALSKFLKIRLEIVKKCSEELNFFCRMQTQLQSLEELAKQSRINYTVVKDTVYYDYFVNMAGAEEELYQKWKEISLNASENPAKYRVWDYPIR